MKLKKLFADDNAVSPVIGVILMVAITVILAAVIGTFVLGLGDKVQSNAPSASFTWDFTDKSGSADTLEVTHNGGEQIKAGQMTIVGDDNLKIDTNGDGTYAGDAASLAATSDSWSASTKVGAGDNILIQAGAGAADVNLANEEVQLTWTSESGDKSSTLASWTGPNA